MAQPTGPGAVFRALQGIFRALLVAQLGFLGVVLTWVAFGDAAPDPALDYYLRYLVPGLNIVMIGLTALLFAGRMRQARRLRNLGLKLQAYQFGAVIRIGLLEGTNLFNLVAYLQTGRAYYLLFFAGMLLLYLRQKPGADEAVRVLHLEGREAELLRQD